MDGSAPTRHAKVEPLVDSLVGVHQGLWAGAWQFALVLDDYHLVGSRSIHDGMAFLLGHLPSRLHVVITSRSDPPLPLARLRARSQLVELRAADLQFTPEEAAALLREVWGLELTPEAVAALTTRTEGWAVGLQLAALSLRERPDPDAFLGAFTGTHHYVLDYLSEEVLERQPDQVRRGGTTAPARRRSPQGATRSPGARGAHRRRDGGRPSGGDRAVACPGRRRARRWGAGEPVRTRGAGVHGRAGTRSTLLGPVAAGGRRLARGRMGEAESGFAEMLAEGRAAPDSHPMMTTCYPLGSVQLERGELGAALRTFQEGLRFATEGGRFSPNLEC
jgi:hypothetical protein